MKLFNFLTKEYFNMTKAKEPKNENFEEFCTRHLECLDDLKEIAEVADEGQPQEFCGMEVEQMEAALGRILVAYWNKGIDDDTEEIETDLDEEIDDENEEEEAEKKDD